MTDSPPVPAEIAEVVRWTKRRDKHFSRSIAGWAETAARGPLRDPNYGKWIWIDTRQGSISDSFERQFDRRPKVPSWIRSLRGLRFILRSEENIYLIEFMAGEALSHLQIENGALAGLAVSSLRTNWTVGGIVRENNDVQCQLIMQDWRLVDDWEDPEAVRAQRIFQNLWRYALTIICTDHYAIQRIKKPNFYSLITTEELMAKNLPYRISRAGENSHIVFACTKCEANTEIEARGMHDADWFIRVVEKRGWHVDGERVTCPECFAAKQTSSKKATAKAPRAMNGVAHDLTALPVAQRRKIRETIDQYYDSDGGFYRAGMTDAKLAAELEVDVEVVETARETMFGPILITAEHISRIADMACTVEALRREVEEAELDALAATLDEAIEAKTASVTAEIVENGALGALVRAEVQRRVEEEWGLREQRLRKLVERVETMESQLSAMRLS